uniref:Myb/SANT-like DNA-binding domain-containing protein n=1 Tax=Salarias fasciatus TaxID=181472 RepID=A0A672I3L5_SALFA
SCLTDTRMMIKLRAANEPLFTGRRNAAKAAWRAILKELGLQGKISTYQMAKKWDNLKRRYKDLKYPPVGMESVADGASSWPWFQLMNEAMEGRLASSAPLLTPVTQDDDHAPDRTPKHRPRPAPPPPPPSDYGPEPFGGGDAAEPSDGPLGDLERQWDALERDRAALDRDRAALDRDRAAVDRDRAALDRDRAALQAERLWLERERAALERDRALVEQDQVALGRDREVLLKMRSFPVSFSVSIYRPVSEREPFAGCRPGGKPEPARNKAEFFIFLNFILEAEY